MKKKFVAVLAGLMALTLGATTAFAANSPATDTVVDVPVAAPDSAKGVVTVDGVKYEIQQADTATVEDAKQKADEIANAITNLDEEKIAEVDGIDLDEEGQLVIGDAVVAPKQLNFVYVNDLVLVDENGNALDEIPEGGMDVTLKADVKVGDNVVVLHFNGTNWEVVTSEVTADGTIVAHFDSLSPIMIAVIDETEEPGEEPSEEPSDDKKPSEDKKPASPKTGEASAFPVVAVALAAGILVCGKKIKNIA